MLSFVTQLWSARTSARQKQAPTARGPAFRPQVEGFEDRVVPAAPANLGPALTAPAAASPASLLPVNITNVAFDAVNGTLTAVGTIGNTAFSTVLSLTTSPNPSPGADCPILNLHVGEIHLDVLGLKVDTSEICLNITAHQGEGLLGDLLCGVSHLLDGGLDLGSVLGGLTGGNLNTLLGGLTTVLNQGLGGLFAPSAVNGGSVSTAGTTQILNLSLGPVDLTLLGLEVNLDNCAGGPVTVDISAEAGAGKLLGNLLTSVSHLLDNPGNGLTGALNGLAHRIGNILNRA